MKHIKIFTLILLSAFLFCFDKAEAKTLRFAMATDVHYSPSGETESSRNITNAGKALNGYVDRVNENNYDFVMFLGDSIDQSNPKSLIKFMEIVSRINKPYYMVIGNHDAHKMSGMTKADFLLIAAKYNKLMRKKQSSYYFYPSPDVIAIVVDGATTGMPSAHGVFTKKTLDWLDNVLEKNKDKKAIIFQHFPLIEPSQNPSHEILYKNEYSAVINRHDNILLIASGHFHAYAENIDEKGIYHLSTPALFNTPFEYQEVEITYDKLPFGKATNFKVNGKLLPAI